MTVIPSGKRTGTTASDGSVPGLYEISMQRQGTSLTGLIFSQIYQILDRRIKGEMTGGSCEEGGERGIQY